MTTLFDDMESIAIFRQSVRLSTDGVRLLLNASLALVKTNASFGCEKKRRGKKMKRKICFLFMCLDKEKTKKKKMRIILKK